MARIRIAAASMMVLVAVPIWAADVDPAFPCGASKQRAMGKKLAARANCYAKATRRNVPVDPVCLAKAESKFAQAFQVAEARGGCATSGDAGPIESAIDAALADLMPRVAPLHGVPCTGNPCGSTCGGNGVCGIATNPGGGSALECVASGTCALSSCSLDVDCAPDRACVLCPPDNMPCCCAVCF